MGWLLLLYCSLICFSSSGFVIQFPTSLVLQQSFPMKGFLKKWFLSFSFLHLRFRIHSAFHRLEKLFFTFFPSWLQPSFSSWLDFLPSLFDLVSPPHQLFFFLCFLSTCPLSSYSKLASALIVHDGSEGVKLTVMSLSRSARRWLLATCLCPGSFPSVNWLLVVFFYPVLSNSLHLAFKGIRQTVLDSFAVWCSWHIADVWDRSSSISKTFTFISASMRVYVSRVGLLG